MHKILLIFLRNQIYTAIHTNAEMTPAIPLMVISNPLVCWEKDLLVFGQVNNMVCFMSCQY